MSEANNAAPVASNPNSLVQDATAAAPEAVESQVEGQEAGAEPAAAIESPKAAAAVKKELEKQLKKYKVKVGGREEDVELDLNDEKEVQKHVQMSRAAQVKMQEAAELRKSAEEFINLLRTNPRKVLMDPSIGVDLKKLAQEVINQEIENAQKSPEQLEKEKLQAELEEMRSKMKKDEDDRKAKEMDRLTREAQTQLETSMESALKTSDLPKTPYTVRKMAEYMMIALKNNVELTPHDLVPLIRKQMIADYKELTAASSDDVLEELIGKDVLSRVRKKTVAKIKAQPVAQTSNAVKSTGNAKPAAEPEKKKINIKDWLKG